MAPTPRAWPLVLTEAFPQRGSRPVIQCMCSNAHNPRTFARLVADFARLSEEIDAPSRPRHTPGRLG